MSHSLRSLGATAETSYDGKTFSMATFSGNWLPLNGMWYFRAHERPSAGKVLSTSTTLELPAGTADLAAGHDVPLTFISEICYINWVRTESSIAVKLMILK